MGGLHDFVHVGFGVLGAFRSGHTVEFLREGVGCLVGGLARRVLATSQQSSQHRYKKNWLQFGLVTL